MICARGKRIILATILTSLRSSIEISALAIATSWQKHSAIGFHVLPLRLGILIISKFTMVGLLSALLLLPKRPRFSWQKNSGAAPSPPPSRRRTATFSWIVFSSVSLFLLFVYTILFLNSHLNDTLTPTVWPLSRFFDKFHQNTVIYLLSPSRIDGDGVRFTAKLSESASLGKHKSNRNSLILLNLLLNMYLFKSGAKVQLFSILSTLYAIKISRIRFFRTFAQTTDVKLT